MGPAQRREAALEAALAEAREGAARAVAERDERLRALGEELAGAHRWGRGSGALEKERGREDAASMALGCTVGMQYRRVNTRGPVASSPCWVLGSRPCVAGTCAASV